MTRLSLIALLFVAATTAVPGLASGETRGTPLSPVVTMFNKWQMQDAPAVVEKVAALGSSRVEFCITLQTELNAQWQPQNFGLLRERRDGGEGNVFYPTDAALRAEFKGYCASAFRRAVEKGLTIAVLLHLDSSGPIQHWRNEFDFDPLVPRRASYEDAMVRPVMEALEETLPAGWPVQISLAGEMGRSVFAHPRSWLTLLKRTRNRGKLRHASFGLGFNFEMVSGQVTPDAAAQSALKRLWSECDFIGISLYQQLSVPPRAADFAFGVGHFVGQFFGYGCALPDDRPLHLVEVGLGGGGHVTDTSFRTPAVDVKAAARTPFVGTNKAEENPWSHPALATFRQQTFQALLEFLSVPMTHHPVRAAYLWDVGSWDVQGLRDEVFADEEISRRIQEHNRASVR